VHQGGEGCGLRAVASINAQLRLEVLHYHVDDQRPIQLHIVEALVLKIWAKGLAGLLGILQDLLLSVLQPTTIVLEKRAPTAKVEKQSRSFAVLIQGKIINPDGPWNIVFLSD